MRVKKEEKKEDKDDNEEEKNIIIQKLGLVTLVLENYAAIKKYGELKKLLQI